MARPPSSFEGEVVERQSFLNGTRSLWIEAEAENGWTAQITLMLPRDEGAPLVEGDITLAQGDASWLGTLSTGAHALLEDEATDAPLLAVTARYTAASGEPTALNWRVADVTLRIIGDTVAAEVVVRG